MWPRWIFILALILVVVLWIGFKLNIKAEEETRMQKVVKIDQTTGDKVEFYLKLYTLQQLHNLIPSVEHYDNPMAASDKYVFCKVKNLSQRHAIYIKFRITSPNAPIKSWSPEIVMRWLSASEVGVGNEQYTLVWLGSPSLGIPDSEVKLDVEILELKHK